ncbi:MAG: hypothetical protein NC218_05210 [Acetobacter sp.]|nr:hypothetical protein [Acetobacter sp.]
MSETAKYLPKTAAALASLQESAMFLEQSAELSAAEQQQLKEKLSTLRQQLTDKAACIDNIINTLNGAIK